MLSLVIDQGNSRCKYALFLNGEIVSKEAYPALSVSKIDALFKEFPDISNCIYSSVSVVDTGLLTHLSSKCSVLSVKKDTPLPVKVEYAGSAGSDRLAAAVAACVLRPSLPSLVIDAGTCITYTFVNINTFKGGAISPGIDLRFRALNEFTENLPLLNYIEGEHPLCGDSTNASIYSGVLNGAIREVDGMISDYRSAHPDLKVYLTGGYSSFFAGGLKNGIFAEPDLVLKGLYHILKFNANDLPA